MVLCAHFANAHRITPLGHGGSLWMRGGAKGDKKPGGSQTANARTPSNPSTPGSQSKAAKTKRTISKHTKDAPIAVQTPLKSPSKGLGDNLEKAKQGMQGMDIPGMDKGIEQRDQLLRTLQLPLSLATAASIFLAMRLDCHRPPILRALRISVAVYLVTMQTVLLLVYARIRRQRDGRTLILQQTVQQHDTACLLRLVQTVCMDLVWLIFYYYRKDYRGILRTVASASLGKVLEPLVLIHILGCRAEGMLKVKCRV
ncbi:hypothetical protein EON64_19335 [archaeon]|nr:MAG: hypothetical protein EON64_19335 [archaeon]